MNLKITVTFFLTIISTYIGSAQCWEESNIVVHPQREINAFHRLSSEVIVAAGIKTTAPTDTLSPGVILKSYDNGITWEEKNARNLYNAFLCLQFPDDSVGYAGGEEMTFVKTKDGGETWSEIQLPQQAILPGRRIADIHFFNRDTGYIFITNTSSIPYLYTQDGGKTWETGDYNSEGILASSIFFLNDSLGYAVSVKQLFTPLFSKTEDGGKNWSVISSINDFVDWSVSSFNPSNLFFTDELTGWAFTTRGGIIHTKDGGLTWTLQRQVPSSPIAHGNREINAVVFKDEHHGWAVGRKGSILYTSDGGNLWRSISSRVDPFSSNPPFNNYWHFTDVAFYINRVEVLGHNWWEAVIFSCDTDQPKPDCGDIDISLLSGDPDSTLFSWNKAKDPCIEGYYLNIGTAPGRTDLLAYGHIVSDTFSVLKNLLPYNSKLYATVLPYNCAEVAEGCSSIIFDTDTCTLPGAVIDTILPQNAVFSGIIIQNDTLLADTLRLPNGCDSIITYQIFVDTSTADELLKQEVVRVFPNPARSILTINFGQLHQYPINIQLLDITGHLKADFSIEKQIRTQNIDISRLPSGIYLLLIKTEQRTEIKKVIIKKGE